MVALRELGRIERTLFALDWMRNVELRRRAQIGLNKGEAKSALARAVFLNRLEEIRPGALKNSGIKRTELRVCAPSGGPMSGRPRERRESGSGDSNSAHSPR